MDYGRVYREFIADRKSKPRPEGYTERHHILPRSLGGGNEPENLIDLTAEDHFFAHLLLAKIHGGGMWHALNAMANGPLVGMRSHSIRYLLMRRRWYDVAKKEFAIAHSKRMKGRFTGQDHPMYGKPCSPIALEKLKARLADGFNPMATPEARKKCADANRGKVRSPETRARISQAKLGKKMSEAGRRAISDGKKGLKLAPETTAKIAAANRGKKRTPEQVAAMRARLTGRKLSPEHAAKCAENLRHASRMRGKRHSSETKARMSAVNQARKAYHAVHGGDIRKITIPMMRQVGIEI